MENTTVFGMLLQRLIILALLHLISCLHLSGFDLQMLNLVPGGGTEEAFSTLHLFPTSTTVVCDKDRGQSCIRQAEQHEPLRPSPCMGYFLAGPPHVVVPCPSLVALPVRGFLLALW